MSPQRIMRVAAAGATALMSVGALAAFGGHPASTSIAKLSVHDVVTQSIRAVNAEPNVVLAGATTVGNLKGDVHIFSADHGRAIRGEVASKSKSIGYVGTIRFEIVNRRYFVMAAPTIWTQLGLANAAPTPALGASLVRAASNRWLYLAPSQAKEFGLTGLVVFHPATFLSDMLRKVTAKERPIKIHGVLVLPMRTSIGAVIYIKMNGSPLPVLITPVNKKIDTRDSVAYPAVLHVTRPHSFRTITEVEKRASS